MTDRKKKKEILLQLAHRMGLKASDAEPTHGGVYVDRGGGGCAEYWDPFFRLRDAWEFQMYLYKMGLISVAPPSPEGWTLEACNFLGMRKALKP